MYFNLNSATLEREIILFSREDIMVKAKIGLQLLYFVVVKILAVKILKILIEIIIRCYND